MSIYGENELQKRTRWFKALVFGGSREQQPALREMANKYREHVVAANYWRQIDDANEQAKARHWAKVNGLKIDRDFNP